MPRDYWFLTRPFRGLLVMQPAMILFSKFKGMKWHHGDTEDEDEKQEILNHNCEYDRDLFNNNFKGSVQPSCSEGVVTDRLDRGSGGRTWASKLFAFGLWYKDRNKCVQLTQAGKALCKADNPLPIIQKQVINFQYPSSYSKAAHMAPNIRIFPFRFILELLLDEDIGYLSELEIALNVLKTTSRSEFETVKRSILTFRGKSDAEKLALRDEIRASAIRGNFEDIANTYVHALYYTQFVDREHSRTSSALKEGSLIYIPPEKKDAVRKILTGRIGGYYSDLLTYPSIDDETFAKRYGLWGRRKDIRPIGRVTPKDLMKSKVEGEIKESLSKQPTLDIDTLCKEITDRLGFREKEIHEIITQYVSKIPDLNEFTLSEFEKIYIKLAVSGVEGSTEFEKRTQELFKELGYEAYHIAPEPRNPDVLVISKDSSHSGIIDSKAYSDYNLPRDHQLRMGAQDGYVEKYREYNHKGTTVSLGFFVYVGGGFSGDIKSKIQEIKENTGINGSCITAVNLLKLLRVHKEGKIPMERIKNLFSLNREILSSDIENLRTTTPTIGAQQKQESHTIREQSSLFDY